MSSTTDILALSFSSTERRKGESAANDRAVQVSSTSDTRVSAFVRSTSPARVTLSASEVGDRLIIAACNCAVAKKEQLCRHVWAVLLALEAKSADFLEGKQDITMAAGCDAEDLSTNSTAATATASDDDATVYRYGSESQLREQNAFKERQKALAKEYRKQQSQKQKEIKQQRREPAFNYPSQVEKARHYFQANGFEMKQPFELSEIIEARKQLSRVFHPDKGGSHEEILELNRNFQILSDYLKS